MFMKPFLFCLVSWVLLRSVANISSREVSFLTHKPPLFVRRCAVFIHKEALRPRTWIFWKRHAVYLPN